MWYPPDLRFSVSSVAPLPWVGSELTAIRCPIVIGDLQRMASDDPAASPVFAPATQVRLRHDGRRVILQLPPPPNSGTSDWQEIWQQLKTRLSGSEKFWQEGASVWMDSGDRLLDARQLQSVADALAEVKLQLQGTIASRRQTAIAAVTAGYSVEQAQLPPPGAMATEAPQNGDNNGERNSVVAALRAEPLYLRTIVRSGGEIRHPGTVVLVGDVNPGGTIAAAGDIIIWGRLRGVAHAGSEGDRRCTIAALHMEPTQLRIADVVARAPQEPPEETDAEVAYITPGGIRVARGTDFLKTHTYNQITGSWSDI